MAPNMYSVARMNSTSGKKSIKIQDSDIYS